MAATPRRNIMFSDGLLFYYPTSKRTIAINDMPKICVICMRKEKDKVEKI
jgi:hypothetical protein